MAETWDVQNLPEGHILIKNTKLVGVVEGTWNRTDQQGNKELAPKWDFMTEPDENGLNQQFGVFSSTDKEELKLNIPYDLILKESKGKDGKFYGHTLKGFAPAGQPINKKEPQSRWQKGQKLNVKAEAIKAAALVWQGTGAASDDVILMAQAFEQYIEGALGPAKAEEVKTKKTK